MAMTIGKDTGSLINHLMSGDSAAPKIGDGATILGWTDRHAGTVIYVCDLYISVQEDTATLRNGAHYMSNDYEYAPNPDGRTWMFKRVSRGKKKGEWRENGKSDGSSVCFGRRDKHHDFSF